MSPPGQEGQARGRQGQMAQAGGGVAAASRRIGSGPWPERGKVMILKGRVRGFSLEKKFGFLTLDNGAGDALLHISALKAAGYVSVPTGTTLRVSIELYRGKKRVTEIVAVDVSTALPGEPPPVLTRRRPHSN